MARIGDNSNSGCLTTWMLWLIVTEAQREFDRARGLIATPTIKSLDADVIGDIPMPEFEYLWNYRESHQGLSV